MTSKVQKLGLKFALLKRWIVSSSLSMLVHANLEETKIRKPLSPLMVF
jgi:hypothetical protein